MDRMQEKQEKNRVNSKEFWVHSSMMWLIVCCVAQSKARGYTDKSGGSDWTCLILPSTKIIDHIHINDFPMSAHYTPRCKSFTSFSLSLLVGGQLIWAASCHGYSCSLNPSNHHSMSAICLWDDHTILNYQHTMLTMQIHAAPAAVLRWD